MARIDRMIRILNKQNGAHSVPYRLLMSVV